MGISSLLNLADMLKIAVFSKDTKVYFLHRNGLETAALVNKDTVIAGAGLELVEGNWYIVETLWADTSISAVTLLYAILEHYKKILPSRHISPAAQSVVRSFYNKYKGTEVVTEGAHSDPGSTPELKAGYNWSPKLRKIPVQQGIASSPDEVKFLIETVYSGFQKAYSDPTRTKKESPNYYWNNFELDNLINLLDQWLGEGGAKENEAIKWITDHRSDLLQIGSRKALKIVELLDQALESM
jgi:hypothetical protein